MSYTFGRQAPLLGRLCHPPDKASLLAKMRAERAVWDGLVDRLPVPILTVGVLPNGWSVKDLTAHIAAYEKWTAAQITAANEGRQPTDMELYGMEHLPPEAATWTVDEANAVIYEQYRDTPLDEVMTFAHQTFQALLTAVAAVPDEDLSRAGAQEWTGHLTLLDLVPAQSYEHYHQHIDELRAVVTGAAPSPRYAPTPRRS